MSAFVLGGVYMVYSRLDDGPKCDNRDELELLTAPVSMVSAALRLEERPLTIFFTLQPDFVSMSFITPPNLAG